MPKVPKSDQNDKTPLLRKNTVFARKSYFSQNLGNKRMNLVETHKSRSKTLKHPKNTKNDTFFVTLQKMAKNQGFCFFHFSTKMTTFIFF